MSVYSGPEIPNSGLVLSIDMGNTAKSFLGANTTNAYWIPTPDATGNVAFQHNGTGTFKRVTSGNYGGYDIKSSDVVYRLDFTTTNGCYYHGNDNFTGFAAGDVVTFSFDYYISPTSTGYPSINYLANIEIYDTNPAGWVGIGGAGTSDPTPSVIGVWKTATITVTVPSFTYGVTVRPLLYPGACNPSRLADTGFILYKNPQLEKRSFRTPFVANTRSNTQSVIDITGLNTVTANSLTFNSDNTYSFNGTSDFLNIPFNSSQFTFNNEQTIAMWIRPTDFSARRNPYAQAYGGGGTITQEINGTYSYYHGAAGTSTSPYQGSGSGFTVTTNETVFLTLVRNAIDVRWYKNGAVYGITTNQFAANTVTGTLPITIGSGYVSNFQGNIYKVDVFNRALTAEEVKELFNANRGRFGI